jgi:hypothetical protein
MCLGANQLYNSVSTVLVQELEYGTRGLKPWMLLNSLATRVRNMKVDLI